MPTPLLNRFIGWPTQTGVLLLGAAVGIGLTTTLTVTGAKLQPLEFTVSVYVPANANVAFGLVGFCAFDVHTPPGPVQLYVVPGGSPVGAYKFNVCPTHIGPLLVGDVVNAGTVIVTASCTGGQLEPGNDAVNTYVIVDGGVAIGFLMFGLLRYVGGAQL